MKPGVLLLQVIPALLLHGAGAAIGAEESPELIKP
jgi:hypothetical protein